MDAASFTAGSRSLLKSRVSRRLFVVFLLCALVPFVLTGGYALLEIGRVAARSDSDRLGSIAKNYALSLIGSLDMAREAMEAELRQVPAEPAAVRAAFAQRGLFSGRVQMLDDAAIRSGSPARLDARQLRALQAGGTVLWHDAAGELGAPTSWLVLRHPAGSYVMTELSGRFLWGAADDFAQGARLAAFVQGGPVLATSGDAEQDPVLEQLRRLPDWAGDAAGLRQLVNLTSGGRDYRARRFELPLERNFGAPSIHVIAWEPTPAALAALSTRQLVFPALMLAGVLLAAWLAVRQLHSQLRPLDALIGVTRRLARRDFTVPVRIESRDEFRDLGDAFNQMAEALRREFEAVDAMAQVDRLLLESRGLETVLDALLPRISRVAACHSVAVVLVDTMAPDRARVFEYLPGLAEALPVRRVPFDPVRMRGPLMREPALQIPAAEAIGDYAFVSSLAEAGAARILMLPLIQDAALAGVLCLGYADESGTAGADGREHSREIADRLSVALANIAHGDALYRQAHFDSLTGLPNRHYFHKHLQSEMDSAGARGSQGALIYVDLDNFKRVNDTAGHGQGDELLRVVAQRLGSCCRGEDMVARLGGDEFAVVVRDGSNPDTVRMIADRILVAVAQPIRVGSREHVISASVGITLFPGDGQTLEEVLKHADIAMYRGKEGGRNRAVFFEPEMNERMESRFALESGLQRALQDELFQLHFQPIVSIDDARLAGAEALLRWPGAPGHAPGPAEFIPAAEQTGLIVGIGEWALDRACGHLREWRGKGLALPYVSVNVSPRQLAEPDFTDKLTTILRRHHLRPLDLLVEITEGVFAEGDQARTALGRIAELGVRIAIDDFGTGYSSLSYLRAFPIHTVKIDRVFVRDVPQDDSARRLLDTIVAMGHGLGKRVIAEGVENAAQLEYLRRVGCDAMQGFHVARPMAPEAFASWMRDYRNPGAEREIRSAG
jgi:diguanylate cyclase (GGDEF)-like protein